MKNFVETISTIGLVIVVAGLGYLYAKHEAAAAIAIAQGDTRACLEAKGADATALETITTTLKSERAITTALRAEAERALSARDDAVKVLAIEAAAIRRIIQESPRADDTCAALADLPVCPAIAAGLWPLAHETTGDQPAHRD